MFESMTYEAILADMLSRVTSDVDKREGSIIYDALAPCAFQLAQNYFSLNNYIDLVSGDTAVGEYLDRVVADYGITRKQATKAIRKIETTGVIEIGARWSIEDIMYTVIESISANAYKAECDQVGAIGNQYSGTLENIDNVSGITATLTDIITSGIDTETDDNLRSRFYTQIRTPSASGNADNYKEWALMVPGVGDAKIFPLWNGNGTVKVLIIDSNMAIDETLEGIVYDFIETVRPIGASVTVASPESNEITVDAEIALDGTKTLEDIILGFTTVFTDYLKGTVFDIYNVSYAKIGSLLLSVDGVADYSNLLVNGATTNIDIGASEMPIAGTITLTEVV